MPQNYEAVFVILPVGCEENTLSESNLGMQTARLRCVCCVCHTGRSLAGFDTPLPQVTCGKAPKFSDLYPKNSSTASANADTKDFALF